MTHQGQAHGLVNLLPVFRQNPYNSQDPTQDVWMWVVVVVVVVVGAKIKFNVSFRFPGTKFAKYQQNLLNVLANFRKFVAWMKILASCLLCRT